MTLRKSPVFASEEEEAHWWYANREKRDEEFATQVAEGRVRVRKGGIAQRIADAKKATAITLSAEDALKAVVIAEEKGIDAQTYLANLIHRALKLDLMTLAQDENDGAPAGDAAISTNSDPVHELRQH